MSPGGAIQYLKHSGKVQRQCEVVEGTFHCHSTQKARRCISRANLWAPYFWLRLSTSRRWPRNGLTLSQPSFFGGISRESNHSGHSLVTSCGIAGMLAAGVVWQRRKSLVCSFFCPQRNLKIRSQFGLKSWSEDTLKKCHFLGKHWEGRGVGIRHTVGCPAFCLPLGLPVLPAQTTGFCAPKSQLGNIGNRKNCLDSLLDFCGCIQRGHF